VQVVADAFREPDDTKVDLVPLVLITLHEVVRGERTDQPVDDGSIRAKMCSYLGERQALWMISEQVENLQSAI
jgi:hypothetical protein